MAAIRGPWGLIYYVLTTRFCHLKIQVFVYQTAYCEERSSFAKVTMAEHGKDEQIMVPSDLPVGQPICKLRCTICQLSKNLSNLQTVLTNVISEH